ncbi:2-phosphosulfolactate phosphatase [Deinococcus roseus]|uniref:Probable 2-phosphosulfolactate phosphatase n=1 Tax=Deinococcus roseus TaxID=392414 RepID=A0ABQ2CZC8_9DEIO|nr:2-phosphosulfolactate phosphatase [Deinococcus roseus]GGJ32092.1 putative 2-phosphosulfolactate phosphatase [Deinococcus roseus]
MRLRVDLLPHGEYSDTVIVVDVLRATTTATVFLEHHADRLLFSGSIEESLGMKAENTIIAGERGGLAVAGFDLGNSPIEAGAGSYAGKTVVMNTTNGTYAARVASASAKHVLLGALRNAHAAARKAKGLAVEEIAIVCSGERGRASLDDTYTAGVLCEYLLAMGEFTLNDGARIALTLRRQVGDPIEPLSSSSGGMSLESKGLGEDIRFCARISESTIVPTLQSTQDGQVIFVSS